jgi:two-component system response regulator
MSDKIILLVEDNPDDVKLALRALKMHRVPNPVVVARDGVEALDYLLGPGSGTPQKPLPALVLLDLKLPLISGLEALGRIRADERTRWLPVVVLTTSSEESDMQASYRLGANSYLRKPVDYDTFTETLGKVAAYWLHLNVTPHHPASCL